MSEITRNPIDVTDTDGNGDKHYLSDYPQTISAEIGGLYEEPKYPTLWRDMTPEEKGALLLAHHEGKEIEAWMYEDKWIALEPEWDEHNAYRIKPEPKVETVTLYGHKGKDKRRYKGAWGFQINAFKENTHRITLTIRDGKPGPVAQVEEL